MARPALLLALLLLVACGDRQAPESRPKEPEFPAPAYTELDGYLVPPVTLPDATLPDSCPLLVEADPKGLIAEPLGLLERMSHVCIATAVAQPGYQQHARARDPAPGARRGRRLGKISERMVGRGARKSEGREGSLR